MIIHVTADDIKHGVPGKCRWCPVARAIWRATGLRANVTGESVQFHGLYYMPLPEACFHFVKAFDAGEIVKPFSFELKDEDIQAIKDQMLRELAGDRQEVVCV